MSRRFAAARRLISVAMMSIAMRAPAHTQGSSFWLHANEPKAYDFGDQRALPPTFGRDEFTLELWIKPDTVFHVGSTLRGTLGQLVNWSADDPKPYTTPAWWYAGNWLLDGFSRPDGFFPNNSRAGSIGLQLYGGGRVRWTFADDDLAVPGKVWAVEAWPASGVPSLLDGHWHHVACVRRMAGVADGGAQLELWVDGEQQAVTRIPQRVNMRQFWDHPPHPRTPPELGGWSWGSEVMTAWGVYFTQYEDYKGLMDELRLWDRARTPAELAERGAVRLKGDEAGLVGWFPFDEGAGTVAHDRLDSSRVITLHGRGQQSWSRESVAPR